MGARRTVRRWRERRWGGVRQRFKSPTSSRPHALRIEWLELRELLAGLSWTPGAAIPVAVGNAAVLATGLGVLVAGGTTNASGTATPTTARLFDAALNSWATAADVDQGRNAGGIGATGSGIFLYGGSDHGQATSSVENYNLFDDGDSAPAQAMSVARYKFAFATDPASGDLFAIGGLGASNQVLASAERYDPVANSWSTIAPLPQALSAASAASDGAGHIIVFGGLNSVAAPVATVYRYTIANNTWGTAASMPLAANSTAAVFGAYGQIYVIGGRTASGALDSVNVFNPVTNEWTATASLPAAVYGAGVTIDGYGNLIVIGGLSAAGNPLSTVYVSPALPAPVGLPAVPVITLDGTFAIYDGTAKSVAPLAYAPDEVTPIDGSFTVTYDGASTPPASAGTYDVLVTFTSGDPGYVSTMVDASLDIEPASPTLTVSGGGTITYDGSPHAITATAVGIDGLTAVSGTFSYTYNGATTAPVNPANYSAIATFTSSDPNYSSATASTTISIPDPTIPTGVTAVGASTSSIRVSWNPVPGPVTYSVYERRVVHDPRGSGSTVYYVKVAGNLSDTSVTIGGLQLRGYTFYVTSTSPSGVESIRSQPASAEPLFAPSLASMLWNGAVTSQATVPVGQTLHVRLLGYGNLPPTYTMVSGPANMSLDPATGLVTYSPDASQLGTSTATFTATNSVGSSTATFSFLVVAPEVSSLNDSGAGSLRQALLDAAASPGQVHVIQFHLPAGLQEIDLLSPLPEVNDPITVFLDATQNVTIGSPGGLAWDQFLSLTKDGAGTLTLTGAQNHPADSTITVVGGTLELDSDAGSNVTLSAAGSGVQLNLSATQHLADLDLGAGAAAVVPPGAWLHVVTGSLTVDPAATFDLADSDLVVHATPVTRLSVLEQITNLVRTGAAGLAWNGPGINSSAAASNPSFLTALGVMLNDDGLGGAYRTAFGGEPVGPNDVLVKYTYYGDADLSGIVDGTDYALTDNGFNAGLSGWFNGDFDYTGSIDGTDYALIDNAFNSQGGPLAAFGPIPHAAELPQANRSRSDRSTLGQTRELALVLGDWPDDALAALAADEIAGGRARKR